MNAATTYDETKRKWFLSMSQIEIYNLRGAVLNRTSWAFTQHALNEMRHDRVTQDEVAKVLRYGKVMEAHNCDPNDICVLLRFTIGRRSIAVVASLVRGTVVTVFANSVESGMRKPDLKKYKWKADLSAIKQVDPLNLEFI